MKVPKFNFGFVETLKKDDNFGVGEVIDRPHVYCNPNKAPFALRDISRIVECFLDYDEIVGEVVLSEKVY